MQDCNAQSQALAASSGRKKRRTDGEAAGGRGKLTLFDKYSMIMRLQTDGSFKQVHASKMYNISPAAVNQMVKRKERIIHDYEFGLNPFSKRVSCMNNSMKILDERLMLFVMDKKKEGQNALSNTQLIWEKAESIANELQLLEKNGLGPNIWRPNRGWWFRFKNRVSSLVTPSFEGMDFFRNMIDDDQLDDSDFLSEPSQIENLLPNEFSLLNAAEANFFAFGADAAPACKRMRSMDSFRTCAISESALVLSSFCPENIFDHEFLFDSLDQIAAN